MHKTRQALKNSFQKLLKKKDMLQALKITVLFMLPNIVLMKYAGPKDENVMFIANNLINFLLLPIAVGIIMLPVIYFCMKFVSEFKKAA